jgi:GT2 family glycosyltransferase
MYGIVLINYKNEDRVIDFVTRFLPTEEYDCHVVIVNNSPSTESNNKILSALLNFANAKESVIGGSRLYLLSAGGNLGYAKGNNLGCRFLLKQFPLLQQLYCLNDDLKFEDLDIFRKLGQEMDKSEIIGCIGPAIYGLDGKDQSPYQYLSVWRRYVFRYLFYPFYKSNDVLPEAKSGVYYRLNGSFVGFKAKVFQDINGFDEGTFLYGEELILAEKLKKFGYEWQFCRDLCVTHHHGLTISSHHDLEQRSTMQFKSNMYYYRNFIGVSAFSLFIAKLSFLYYFKFARKLTDIVKGFVNK